MQKGGFAKKAIIAFLLLGGAYVTAAQFLQDGFTDPESAPKFSQATEETVLPSPPPAVDFVHPTQILRPGVPRVLTGRDLPDGTPETIACGTCHSTKPPNLATASGDDLDEFHTGLTFVHGSLNCLSCHNAEDYDSLRLADGRPVSFPDTMTLCAQCHGPQHRDYQNGSHGGMTGFWDLTKGPRKRNHCITCHDPHAPAFPQVMPVFKPTDTGGHSPLPDLPVSH